MIEPAIKPCGCPAEIVLDGEVYENTGHCSPNCTLVGFEARLKAMPRPTVECEGDNPPLDMSGKDKRRKAIGIEIEEKYCEIAARRLSQEVFDFGGQA